MILAAIKIGWVGGLLLKFGLPALIGIILSSAYFIPMITSLRDWIDTMIKANEDGKVTQQEYDDIAEKAKVFKDSFSRWIIWLISIITKFKKG